MKLTRSLLAIALMSFAAISFAKAVNLYDQPKTDAKVIGAIDLAKGIVPIYTPKEGGWIKVGDPTNGNVGWVKAIDIEANSGSVSITQEYSSDGKSLPKSYQVIKFDAPTNVTAEQFKEMQRRQQILQKNIEQVTDSFNRLFQENFKMPVNVPILVPVVVPPQPAPAKTNTTVKQTTTTTPSKPSTQK